MFPGPVVSRIARLLAVAVLACALCAATAGRADAFAGKAIWGPLTRNGVNQFPLYHQLGVKIFEDDLNWYEIAPTQPANPTNPADPAYQWPAAVDQALAQASRYHMQVLLQLIGAPPWADGGQAGFGWAPTSPVSFAQFAQAAARRYPHVHLWMIWGEPTKAGNFQPEMAAEPGLPLSPAQAAAPHLYAQMLNDAYGTLKAVSRKNVVIGGSTFTTGQIDTLQWLQNLKLPNGRRPRIDMWAHNPFSYQPPSFSASPSPFDEVQFSDLPKLEQRLKKAFHKTLPLFLSEFEIPTHTDDTFNFWVDPALAATWVTDALRLSRTTKYIYSLGWINVFDDPPGPDGVPDEAGGLIYANGRPKPDFYAFKNG